MPKEQSLHQLSFPLFDEPEPRSQSQPVPKHNLREVLSPYINLRRLRRLVSESGDLHESLTTNEAPAEVLALLSTLADLLRPPEREQINGPADMAALLMVEMGHLTQEQLRVVCLSTKYHVQKIHLVYQGNVNSSQVRVGEVFREPLRLNSYGVIIAHNHPSGDPTPSMEDILLTQQIVQAGNLLGVEVLDHIVVAQGRWLSLRERTLGFSS